MEVAGPHDEVDFGGAADIGDGVAGHGHDVGDPARFERIWLVGLGFFSLCGTSYEKAGR
jgi:hypothetical protein